jgi:hypothetical protein
MFSSCRYGVLVFAIAAWGIPAFTHAIESSTGTAVIEADSIVERAGSGYLRFGCGCKCFWH